jgi:hypothetical protein
MFATLEIAESAARPGFARCREDSVVMQDFTAVYIRHSHVAFRGAWSMLANIG